MSDLVRVLRGQRIDGRGTDEIMRLAADEIESLRSRLAKLQGGEACCVTHGEGACQLTCVKCNDELRSRLAEFQRLYRGQLANDGSYPDHLFTADSGSAVTDNCPLCGEPRADHAEIAPNGKPECRMKCKRYE